MRHRDLATLPDARVLAEPVSLVLRPSAESAARARYFVLTIAGELLTDERRDDLQLLVSEVVTNAIEHARTTCRVTIARDGDLVRVEVDDDSRALPRRRARAGADGGFGLWILDQLADEWGVERRRRGKCVWFRI